MTPRTYLNIRQVVLLVLAVIAGAALGMLLWLALTAFLFPFFWSGGIIIGFWVSCAITVVLVLIAAVRFGQGKDRLCYWHAVLGGLVVFMVVMGVSAAVEYGFHTVPHSSRAIRAVGVLDEP